MKKLLSLAVIVAIGFAAYRFREQNNSLGTTGTQVASLPANDPARTMSAREIANAPGGIRRRSRITSPGMAATLAPGARMNMPSWPVFSCVAPRLKVTAPSLITKAFCASMTARAEPLAPITTTEQPRPFSSPAIQDTLIASRVSRLT